MVYVCRACALQAQRSAISTTRQVSRRTFTQSSTRQRHGAVPALNNVVSPDLEASLATLREKYFFPAYLNKRQRNLIYKDKFKSELENSPASATLGDEDFALEHVDRRKDIPARRPLVNQVLRLMNENKEWNHLPGIMEGLHTARATPDVAVQERIIRKATEAGQLGIVLSCFHRPKDSGLTLRSDEVVQWVTRSLRRTAVLGSWSKKSTEKAIKYANEVAMLLEQHEHTRGKSPHQIVKGDPRASPLVIGAYLELFAVNAFKHHEKKDHDGSVKKYAQRLMACIDNLVEPPQEEISKKSSQSEFFAKFPVWHGLVLADKILGGGMPEVRAARELIQRYEARLEEIVQAIEAHGLADQNEYAAQAVQAWQEAQSE